MANPNPIPHPFLLNPGTRQADRYLFALDPENIKIDDRKLGELLVYLHEFAAQVNFYDLQLGVHDWQQFFTNSLPFQLASIQHLSVDQLNSNINTAIKLVRNEPSAVHLVPVCQEIYHDQFAFLHRLSLRLNASNHSFAPILDRMVASNLQLPLKQFINDCNCLKSQGVELGIDFIPFLDSDIWGLDWEQLYAEPTNCFDIETNAIEGSLNMAANLEQIQGICASVLGQIQTQLLATENYLQESLVPLQEAQRQKHDPQLGLLFTFLELFAQFQEHLNQLSRAHLDYFFKTILGIKTRSAKPDEAIVVFELQQHIDQYKLDKGRLVQDATDANDTDIVFALDEEIVLDKAQATSFSALHLNKFKLGAEDIIEGVYVAPNITKADGKEEDFQGDGPHSWPTLGAKASKLLLPADPDAAKEVVAYQNYPKAQQGFVLASPVLLLQEGKRKIEVRLDLGTKTDQDDTLINWPSNATEPIFIVKLSSAEEWVKPARENLTFNFVEAGNKLLLNIEIDLSEADPPIQAFLPEGELNLIKSKYPLLSIELNPKATQSLDTLGDNENCCLYNLTDNSSDEASIYHYLQSKVLEQAEITVSVCEMKSTIVVQNDENLQDVNALVYPFGVRPSVEADLTIEDQTISRGSHFFIGSHEVFGKAWSSVQLNLNWKDKPDDFEDYYLGYEDITIGFAGVKNNAFKFEASLLSEGKWVAGPTEQPLFQNIGGDDLHPERPNKYQQRIGFESTAFTGLVDQNRAEVINQPLTELTKAERDGFLRLTLKEQDFQHRKYPFILARQMMAFGKFPEDFVFGAVYAYIDDEGNRVGTESEADFNAKFKRQQFSLKEYFKNVERIFQFGDDLLPKTLPIVAVFRKAIDQNILETLETNLSQNVVALLEGGTYSDGTNINPGLLREKIEAAVDALCGPVDDDLAVPDQASILADLLFYIEDDPSANGFTALIETQLLDYLGDVEVDTNQSISLTERNKFADDVIADCLQKVDESDFKQKIKDAFTDILDETTTTESIIEEIKTKITANLGVSETDADLVAALDQIETELGNIFSALLTNSTEADKGIQRIDKLIGDIKTAIKDRIQLNNEVRDGIAQRVEDELLDHLTVNTTSSISDTDTEAIIDAIKQSVSTSLTNLVNGSIRSKMLDVFREAFTLDTNFKFIVPAGGTNEIIEDIKDAINKAFSSVNLEDGLFLDSEVNLTSDFWTEGLLSANASTAIAEYDMPATHRTQTDINDDLQGRADPVTAGTEKDKFNKATAYLGELELVRNAPSNEEALEKFVKYIDEQYQFDYDSNGDIIDGEGLLIARAERDPLSYGDFVSSRVPDLVQIMPYLGLAEIAEGLYFYTKYHRLQSIKIQSSTVVIPNEPYTPILKDISLDYTATAASQNADIDFYQLLPFEKSFQQQSISNGTPHLLYKIEDEGTLFIGVQDLNRAGILNLYFQMAEATADSEYDPAPIQWAYIKDNQWEELRDQFQILEDGTQGFTRSGIVKIAVPSDISKKDVSLLPPGEEPLYWFKASALNNTAAICETIAVYTQAVKATASLQANNDPNRLAEPLPKESLDKLAEADSAITTVLQPDQSRGGAPPEEDASTNYYTRVSERLRHKDRAVNAFDYERIVLEAFPSIQTVKCISHSRSLAGSSYRQDLHLAPGFVSVALIPDLDSLKSVNSATPKAPISLLNEIKEYLQSRLSPFVQLKVVNPRYEAVHVEVDVQFKAGLNVSFYLKELAREIRLHLTPWLYGDQSKLCFAHGASQSDLVGFVESRPYVDFISCIKMAHEQGEPMPDCKNALVNLEGQISPRTARSILFAGEITTRHFAEIYREHYQDPPLA